ncbi:MAG: hypothetical protein KKC18_04925 [Chloroflexi bacterium]|nr:hypothetical protein [Chloroflexota bacterium]
MDTAAKRHLEQLLTLARAAFSDVVVIRHDISEERAILRLKCRCGTDDIHVTEIVTPTTRWYSYYRLREGKVLRGHDNYSDRPALRLKYGQEFTQHLYEPIPHLHEAGGVTLTDEMTCAEFVSIVTAKDTI